MALSASVWPETSYTSDSKRLSWISLSSATSRLARASTLAQAQMASPLRSYSTIPSRIEQQATD